MFLYHADVLKVAGSGGRRLPPCTTPRWPMPTNCQTTMRRLLLQWLCLFCLRCCTSTARQNKTKKDQCIGSECALEMALMGCSDSTLTGVGAPHQCPLGKLAMLSSLYTDVRSILMVLWRFKGGFVGKYAQSALDQKLVTEADFDARLAMLFRVRMRLSHFDPLGR